MEARRIAPPPIFPTGDGTMRYLMIIVLAIMIGSLLSILVIGSH